MKAKLKAGLSYIQIGVVVLLVCLLVFFFINRKEFSDPLEGRNLLRLIFIPIFMALLIREMIIRMVVINFKPDRFSKKSFYGMGKRRTYTYKELDGYKLHSEGPHKGRLWEYITLIKDGKAVATISSLYHTNYKDLKNFIQLTFKRLPG